MTCLTRIKRIGYAFPFLTLLSINQLKAQTPINIDSIVNIMETGTDSTLVESSNSLFWHFISTEPDKAHEFILRSLELARSKNDLYGIANAYNVSGIYYQRKAQYEKAIEMHIRALDYYEQSNDEENKGWGLNNIGTVYLYLADFSKAKTYLESAYLIFVNSGLEEGIAETAGNLGTACNKLGLYDSALMLFDQSREISKALGMKFEEARMLNNSGVLYYNLGQFKRAEQAFEMALIPFQELNDTYGLIGTYINIGGIKTKLNDLENAENALFRAVKLAQKYDAKIKLIDAYNKITNIYVLQEKFQEAYRYQKKLSQLKDSVLSKQNFDKINEIEGKYQNERKQRQIEILNSENEISQLKLQESETNRNIAITVTVLVFLIGILSINHIHLKRQQDKNRLRIQNLDTEHRLLRAQMNPHFIFNSLNSIQCFLSENESQIAERYLLKFAKLMRSTLESTNQKSITLAEEIDMLKLYMELEQLRFEDKFTFEIEYPTQMDPDEIQIPPMMLQPFVENAILHGIQYLTSQGKISIRYSVENALLCCEVIDNGIGRKEAAKRKNSKNNSDHTPRGLTITKERIERIQKESQLGAKLIIENYNRENSIDVGTRVLIKVPLKYC